MPRILPRLLDKIAQRKGESWSPLKFPRKPPKSLYKPLPPRPSFHPSHHSKSILLAPAESNPITSSRLYNRHKTLPPVPHLSGRIKKLHGHDVLREMSHEELQWWSDPYLRMLASPIRKCVITSRYLPSEFLIRIGPLRLSPDLQTKSTKAALIPDGLQHPKFTPRRAHRAGYMLCNKEAVRLFTERAAYRRVGHSLSVHALFAEQTAHLLRLRVLQELELLADKMESLLGKPRAVYSSKIIRRLTLREWKSFKETSVIPFPDAVAVLVVPPLNKDPITKQRPEGSMSAAPLVQHERPTSLSPPLPLSTLHATTSLETMNDNTVPQARVPYYNGISLFPAREQRAALHALLLRLLTIERKARHRVSLSPEKTEATEKDDTSYKPSHAFLLCSNAEIIRRADVAAVAIALWRVRMFEGGGWDDEDNKEWVKTLES